MAKQNNFTKRPKRNKDFLYEEEFLLTIPKIESFSIKIKSKYFV